MSYRREFHTTSGPCKRCGGIGIEPTIVCYREKAERDAQIVEMAKCGDLNTDIAAKFGLHQAHVSQILLKAGESPTQRRRRRLGLPELPRPERKWWWR